jgi:hypothetical protein
MVGDGHEVHPSREQLLAQFTRVRVAIGKIEPAE